MGETITDTVYYDYTDSTSTGILQGAWSTIAQPNQQICYLYAKDISALQNVESVYIRYAPTFIYDGYSPYYPDYDDLLNTYTFDLKIKGTGTIVGYGDVTISFITDSAGRATKAEFYFEFDSYDVSGLSGANVFEADISGFTTLSFNNYNGDNSNPGSITTGFYAVNSISKVSGNANTNIQTNSRSELHQQLTYNYNSDTKILYAYVEKNNTANMVTITGNDSTVYYTRQDSDDIELNIYDNTPVVVNVTNPYSSEIWSDTLPTTRPTGPSPTDNTATLTSYVYDAVTGHLLGDGHTVYNWYEGTNTYGSCTWPGGVSHTTIDWSGETACNITYGADGYSNSTTQKYVASVLDTSGIYLAVGDEITVSAYLMPTGGGPTNTTYYLSFEVVQEVAPNSGILFLATDAAVTCDGEQRLTGPTGTTWFNVTAGTYDYTIQKNGFETVQGSVSVSGNTKESVTLYQTMAVPTVPPDSNSTEIDPEQMHESVAEAYAEFGAFIPEAVMIGCVLFLLSMFKKF